MKKTLAMVLALLMLLSSTALAAVEEQAGAWTPTEEMHYTYWAISGHDIASLEVPKENVPSDWLEEKTKVIIDEAYGNGGLAPSAKMQTMIAGGTMPDFGYFYNFEGFGALVEAQQVWGLTPEIIQQYAPNVWNKLPEAVWNAVTGEDGYIYAIPYSIGAASIPAEMQDAYSTEYFDHFDTPWISIRWSTNSPFFIRDDILKMLYPDAMGYEEAIAKLEETNAPFPEDFVLEDIDTTEKFVELWYKIAELGLTTEAGKPVYTHGVQAGDNWMMLVALGGEMVGYREMEYMTVYNATEDKLEFGLETEMVKEAASLVNQMVLDNVIDPECLVHTTEVYKEKLLAGQYAIVQHMGISAAGYSIDTLNDALTEMNAGYHYVPIYTCVEQLADYPYMRRVGSNVSAQYLVPFKSMDEEKLYQWLNWINVMFTDEWDMVSQWGIEGETYAIDEATGLPYYLDEAMQRTIVEGTNELDWKDCKGLYNYNRPNNFQSTQICYTNNPYTPALLYKDVFPISEQDAYTRFSYSSEYAKNVKLVGNFQSWHADYGALEEVTDMFATRDIWENAFKQSMAAKEGEFEAKWADALVTLYECFDVKGLLEHQEPIFRANQEAVKAQGVEYQRTID